MACACKNKTVSTPVKQVVKKNISTKKTPSTQRTIIKRVIGRRHPLV